jgi:hypothetical protein
MPGYSAFYCNQSPWLGLHMLSDSAVLEAVSRYSVTKAATGEPTATQSVSVRASRINP